MLLMIMIVSGCVCACTEANIQQIFAGDGGVARFVSAEGKMGLMDESGKILVPAIYEDIDIFDENGIAITERSEGEEVFWGLIDRRGRKITENDYSIIARQRNAKLGWSSGYGTYYAQNAEEKEKEIALFADGTSAEYPSSVFLESETNVDVINAESFFVQGSVFWYTKEGWKLFDKTAKPLNEDVWEYYVPFPEGGGAVEKNGLWGIVASDGRLVVDYSYAGWQPQYTPYGIIVSEDEEGTNCKKNGVISFTGEEILPIEYDYISTFSEGSAVAALHGKYGYVDKDFRWTIEPQWEAAGPFSAGMAAVKKDGFTHLIDLNGNIVFSCAEEEMQGKTICWDECIAVCDSMKGTITLYDREGEVMHFFRNVWLPHTAETKGKMLRIIETSNNEAQYGYLDLSAGKMAIPPTLYSAEDFAEGFAIVRPTETQGYGVIDSEGNYVIAPEYELITRVCDCGGIWFDAYTETENSFDHYTFNRDGEVIKHIHSDTPSNG